MVGYRTPMDSCDDPLVDDWEALDQLVQTGADAAGIVRTRHWHQRSVSDVASRYRAQVWAKQHRTVGCLMRLTVR